MRRPRDSYERDRLAYEVNELITLLAQARQDDVFKFVLERSLEYAIWSLYYWRLQNSLLYFFSMPCVGAASLLVAQQNMESLPQASQVCLTSSFDPNPTPVVVMVDLQPEQ